MHMGEKWDISLIYIGGGVGIHDIVLYFVSFLLNNTSIITFFLKLNSY